MAEPKRTLCFSKLSVGENIPKVVCIRGTETTMHCVDHCLFCCCGAITWLPQSWQKEFYKHRAVSCHEAEKLGQTEAERKLYFKFVSTIEEWISRIVAGGRKNMYVKLPAHEHD